MVHTPSLKRIHNLAPRRLPAVLTIFFFFWTAVCAQSSRLTDDKKPRPFNLLVLGDSILWGQGLKEEHKAWYLVKNWLQQTTGRDVRGTIEAHAGAVIGSVEPEPAVMPIDDEIGRAWPTINQQIDAALKSYADPAGVDLVLVDGCINDLDSRRILNAANTSQSIREYAHAKCGSPVEELLTRIVSSFSSAHVIVTGYFPIISDKTPNDLFMRALAKRFYAPEAGAPPLNDKQLRARLISISAEWYRSSNEALAAAAANADLLLKTRGSPQRVMFAQIPFAPENSFAASQSQLWGFDASALRKFLVVITLGKVTLRANDERRSQRVAACKEFYRRPFDETSEQKIIREDHLVHCRLAAIGHPNKKGAAVYAESIRQQIRVLINQPGWLRNNPAASR